MSKSKSAANNFIEIDPAKCTGCGSCITICGGEVFVKKGKKAVVAHLGDCLECYNCDVVCLPNAIRMRVPKGGTGKVHHYG